ncbi:hypothetical protein IZ6_19740 [Terrihabitans soli]|uniref:Tripartite tricarboxylate transporter substrate binding protein n=1 Tax=Terrihabitans soli TaxID=708113 RepID=A0A6S6QQC2_9HYPH|nr:hypothetical protein [Terrihabitans soli]BCJ91239.1 hypothetical protein IZ6_19740 [Terrihabitans soli]
MNLKQKMIATLGAVSLVSAMAAAPAVAADFTGKTIRVVAPFAPGGGGDLWTRLVVPHLARHLPGKPTMIIENIAGGGQVTGANTFEREATKDGLTVLTVSSSLFFSYSLAPDAKKIQFDPHKWRAVAASPVGSVFYVNQDPGVKTAKELGKVEDGKLVVPIAAPRGSDIRTLLSLELLGTQARPVVGLDASEANLAFFRGELNGGRETAGTFKQAFEPLVKEGKVIPLFSFGYPDKNGKLGRDPEFPDLPSFDEAYKQIHGKDPSGPAYDVWKVFFYSGVINSKGMVLPGGCPQDVVDAYDKAFEAMSKDPVFIEAAKAELGGYPLVLGDAAQKSWENAITMSPETRKWVDEWLKERFKI